MSNELDTLLTALRRTGRPCPASTGLVAGTPARSQAAAERRRAAVSGGGPATVGDRQRAALDPLRAGPPDRHVSAPARAVGLQQAAARRRAAAQRGAHRAGPRHPVLGRSSAAAEFHAAALRGLPPDRQTLRSGRARRLRLLRQPLPLLLGLPAL